MAPNSKEIIVPKGANIKDASTFNLPVMRLINSNQSADEPLTLEINNNTVKTKLANSKSLFQPSGDSTLPETRDINYAANKTGLLLWFVSNCRTKRTKTRVQYAKELSKYIHINVYGGCSKAGAKRDPCKRNQECVSRMMSQHKFYLSFENARCHW